MEAGTAGGERSGPRWPWDEDRGLLWRRLGAYVVDLLFLSPLICAPWLWLIGTIAYHGPLEGVLGWSLGKRVFGLRVVRVDGRPPGPWLGLARGVLRVFEASPFAVGQGWVCWKHIHTSAGHQRIGDRLTRTFVIRTDQPMATVRSTSLGSWV